MKKILTTLLISVMITPAISAQQGGGSQRMNLEECMAYAVNNSYKTARSANDAANSKIDYTGAILNHLPSISAYTGAGSNFGRGIDPATNTYINTATFGNNISASANITVFNGLSMLNRTRSAKIAKLRGDEQLRESRDRVAEEAMVAYAEVVYANELVTLREQQVEQYKVSERLAQRKLELGNGSEADLAQIRATLASHEYNVIAVRNQLENAIIRLKDCMNFPLEDSLIIEPSISEAEVFEAAQSVEQMYAFAETNNTKAIIQKMNLQYSKISLDITKGYYYPSISASAGIGTSYNVRIDGTQIGATSYGEQLKNNVGESVNLSMNIPIFNRLSTRFSVAKSRNNYAQAKRDHAEALRRLNSEIRQAMMDLEASHSQWIQAQRNVEHQRIANAANTRKYNEGLLGIIELQTSDSQLLQSEIDLRNSYLKYQIKVREVNYYKGIPYIL